MPNAQGRALATNYSSESLVRSSGFEPPRYCYRQPLKLVRLPVPPRPHRGEMDILTGGEEGCKPSDATLHGQQAGSQVRLYRLANRSCFRGARSPRSQNCQQDGHHCRGGDNRVVDAHARKAPSTPGRPLLPQEDGLTSLGTESSCGVREDLENAARRKIPSHAFLLGISSGSRGNLAGRVVPIFRRS
jgi:hypothetical protein